MANVWPSLLRQTCSLAPQRAAPIRPVFPVLFSSWPFSFAALGDRYRSMCQPEQQTLSSPMHGTSYSTDPRRSALTPSPQRLLRRWDNTSSPTQTRILREQSSLVHIVHWIREL